MKLDYKKTKLKNGVRVVTVPMKNTAAVTPIVFIGTGSHYEEKEVAGVSHYLEHLFFKGSQKYPSALKISTILDGLGADYNAFTSKELTAFYVKVVKDKLEVALDVMGDYLKNPLFDTREIKRERGVILEELRMHYDMPERHVFDLFKHALYGDQPAGRDVGGTVESVSNTTPKDIKEYFKEQYVGENIVVVFAGNISHNKGLQLARKYFGDLPDGKPYAKNPVESIERKEPSIVLEKRKSDQTHIMCGFEGYSMQDERIFSLIMLSNILGGGMSSRLFSQIRERRGLAYYVGASTSSGTDYGFLYTRAGVTNDKLEQAIKVLVRELKDVKRNLVDKSELKKAKSRLEGLTLLELESSDGVGEELGAKEVLLGEIMTPPEELEKIKSVTAKDIKEAANDIIQKENMAFSLVGPYHNKKKLNEILSKI